MLVRPLYRDTPWTPSNSECPANASIKWPDRVKPPKNGQKCWSLSTSTLSTSTLSISTLSTSTLSISTLSTSTLSTSTLLTSRFLFFRCLLAVVGRLYRQACRCVHQHDDDFLTSFVSWSIHIIVPLLDFDFYSLDVGHSTL